MIERVLNDRIPKGRGADPIPTSYGRVMRERRTLLT